MKRGALLLLGLTLAVGLSGCGGDSSTTPEVLPDTTPPGAPQGLTVDKMGDGEVQMHWSAAADSDWEYFVVYRAEGGGASVAMDTTYGTSLRDTGLEYETQYAYHVVSVDQAGNVGDPSLSVSGQPFNTLSPQAPQSLRVVGHNIPVLRQLDMWLDWDANAEADLDVYRVYRSEGDDFAGSTPLLSVGEPRFVDEGIEVGIWYWYWVTAVDRGGKESPPSPVAADVALAPPALAAPVQGELTPAAVRFHWHTVPDATGYRVIVTTSPTSGERSDMALTSDTTAVFQGRVLSGEERATLVSGDVYHWKVVASTQEDGTENSVSEVESFKVN